MSGVNMLLSDFQAFSAGNGSEVRDLMERINNPTAAELRGMKLGCWSFVGNYFRPRGAG